MGRDFKGTRQRQDCAGIDLNLASATITLDLRDRMLAEISRRRAAGLTGTERSASRIVREALEAYLPPLAAEREKESTG